MRPAALLLAGLALVGGGVAVLLSRLPAHWWLGVALVVVGLVVKVGGFLVSEDPVRPRPGGRQVTTLDGQLVEAPRPGVPTGRAVTLDRTPRVRRATPVSPQAPVGPSVRRTG